MTPSTEPQHGAPATDAPAVPLDEVMLAMDVVDTLRHERAMVEASLDDDRRERGLIERIKAIYASQGIEVPDEIIADGVKALEQDRFTYDPPERTFAVRLAELYIDRGKWTKRTAILAAAVAVVWLAIAVPRHLMERARIEAFADRLVALSDQTTDLGEEAGALRTELGAVRGAGVSAGAAEILDGAERSLDQLDQQLAAVRTSLSEGPDPRRHPEELERLGHLADRDREALASIASGLGGVSGQLQAVSRLATIGSSVQRVLARLDGLDVEPEVKSELTRLAGRVDESVAAGDVEGARQGLHQLEDRVDGLVRTHELRLETKTELAGQLARLAGVDVEPSAAAEIESRRTRVEAALAAGEVAQARDELGKLRGLIDVLDQSYELRIVSRGNVKSGVWRHPNGQRGRNYYIVVEAVGPDGKVLSLDVLNEETRRTSRVATFAVRVPESVYEKVKADKLDNGLIDDQVFGVKKRGARDVEYRFEVAGGMITEW